MKVSLIDGRTVATAETIADVKTLMSLVSEGGVRAYRKHKKHNHKKVCYKCGRAYKGKQGLAKHQSKCLKVVVPGIESSQE